MQQWSCLKFWTKNGEVRVGWWIGGDRLHRIPDTGYRLVGKYVRHIMHVCASTVHAAVPPQCYLTSLGLMLLINYRYKLISVIISICILHEMIDRKIDIIIAAPRPL